MEIKSQLDATDDFYCRSYCLVKMFWAPLCPSSGAQEYYTGGCCMWYLVLWFSSCRYGVKLRVMYPVCGLLHFRSPFHATPPLILRDFVITIISILKFLPFRPKYLLQHPDHEISQSVLPLKDRANFTHTHTHTHHTHIAHTTHTPHTHTPNTTHT